MDAAAVPAVAAVGATERLELLPQDRHAAVAAVAGLHVQDDPVDEARHRITLRRRRATGPRPAAARSVRPAPPGTMLTTLRPRFVPNCDRTRGEREQRVVAAAADQVARVELGAPLADQDLAGRDHLAAEALHAEPLRGRVATVARAGRTLFVSHGAPTSRSRCRLP